MTEAGPATDPVARFAGYVAALGRGPGRSRALSREEAADAMRLLLTGIAQPMQVGAFLMLLRYRGEDPVEIAGLVEGAASFVTLAGARAALDWPSYGAGRTRGAPWFLLAALTLAGAGFRVLMHGTNEFSGGQTVEQGLAALSLAPCATRAAVPAALESAGFAYLPARVMCPLLADLLGARALLGLRSPLNTVARLLNPAGAPASVDGVFHPPYIETHLASAALLGRCRLVVLKGGGGEAERNPHRAMPVHVWDARCGRAETTMPALAPVAAASEQPDMAAIWRGAVRHEAIEARIVGTIALGLLALEAGGDAQAAALWENRAARGAR